MLYKVQISPIKFNMDFCMLDTFRYTFTYKWVQITPEHSYRDIEQHLISHSNKPSLGAESIKKQWHNQH